MKNRKRAIILDMDETLEHGITESSMENRTIMILRPNIDELIIKLQEAKSQGIDILLCTTAREPWVEKFLTLKPEFRNLFDKVLTRANEDKWKNFSKEKYPLEYEARSKNINLEYLKPVTTFGYDVVLFIDDNKMESVRLKLLFEITQGKLQKDVTYFSGFGFKGGRIGWSKILGYKKASKQSLKMAQLLQEYLDIERNNVGCNLMCSAIDNFIKKEFTAGLTIVDDEYLEEYNIFNNKLILLQRKLEYLSLKLEKEFGTKIFDYTNNELQALLETDKHYPYEDLELAGL